MSLTEEEIYSFLTKMLKENKFYYDGIFCELDCNKEIQCKNCIFRGEVSRQGSGCMFQHYDPIIRRLFPEYYI